MCPTFASFRGIEASFVRFFTISISNALKFASPSRPPVISIQSKKLDPREHNLILDNPSCYCLVTVSDNGNWFRGGLCIINI
jgi:hypothetical protein